MADHSYHTKKNSKIVQGVDPLYDVDIDDIVRNIDIDYIPDFFVLNKWILIWYRYIIVNINTHVIKKMHQTGVGLYNGDMISR